MSELIAARRGYELSGENIGVCWVENSQERDRLQDTGEWDGNEAMLIF